MVATKAFPKSVQLFEAPGCNSVVETLAKGARLAMIERVARRSPGVRAALREIAETQPAIARGLGLQHLNLAETAARRPVRPTRFLQMSSEQIFETLSGRSSVSTVETAPRAPAKKPAAAKGYLQMSSDEIWEKIKPGF